MFLQHLNVLVYCYFTGLAKEIMTLKIEIMELNWVVECSYENFARTESL